MNSLRLRLMLGTLAIVTGFWLLAAIGAWREALHETDEILDAHLAESAALLVMFSDHQGVTAVEHLVAHSATRKIAFQVWRDDRLLLHSANAPDHRLSEVDTGFSHAERGGQSWRVFGQWDPAHRTLVQVAETRAARADIGQELATHLLVPLALALPALALALVWLVRSSLQPLDRLSGLIAHRSPGHMEALVLERAPRELSPIVDRLNALLARLAESLEQERRLTADAAHELRTPLAALRAHAQVAENASDPGERQTALGNVILATDRATHLVEQLLTLRRLDALGPDGGLPDCDLHTIAVEVLAEQAPMALEKGVELVLADDAAVPVRGDPTLLAILLRNLVDNAVRYSPSGSPVTVSLGQAEGSPILTVSDHGPGIPESERSRVLQRFVRGVGNRESGAGLGLSIVLRIAELHGAQVRFATALPAPGLLVTVHFA